MISAVAPSSRMTAIRISFVVGVFGVVSSIGFSGMHFPWMHSLFVPHFAFSSIGAVVHFPSTQ